jgi:hypothetical protein
MQYACTIVLSVAYLALQNFPHYLINGTILEEGKKALLNMKCVFRVSVQLLSDIFFILRKFKRDRIKTAYRPSCKIPFILVRFNETWILSTDLRVILKYEIWWKSSSGSRVVPCAQRDRKTDGQSDRHDETKSHFSQFCERGQGSSAADFRVSPAAPMNLRVPCYYNFLSAHDAQRASQPSANFVSFVTVLRVLWSFILWAYGLWHRVVW